MMHLLIATAGLTETEEEEDKIIWYSKNQIFEKMTATVFRLEIVAVFLDFYMIRYDTDKE